MGPTSKGEEAERQGGGRNWWKMEKREEREGRERGRKGMGKEGERGKGREERNVAHLTLSPGSASVYNVVLSAELSTY